MSTEVWRDDDIGDLTGVVALVTGANSGIGYETAASLAAHGAHVILACRNPDKARQAYDKLENDLDRSSLEVLPLDLSDLTSVRQAARWFIEHHARLDILVNNAGVMGTPYQLTVDGFGLQMGTNHLGHFALTGLLLERLITSGQSRVITVSSHLHRLGHIDLSDVAATKPGNTWQAYGSSKLANLLFTAELARRFEALGAASLTVAAHPGWTRSNLAGNGAALGPGRWRAKFGRLAGRTLGQATATGALPTLYAATAPAITNGQYVGPSHLVQMFGPPKVVSPNRAARSAEVAAGLWAASEELTGVRYSVPALA